MTKQIIRVGSAIMITLVALGLLWLFRTTVIYVLISLILAATLRPLVNHLSGRRPIMRVVWILLYLMALGSIGLLLFLTVKTAINEIQQLSHTVSVQNSWTLPEWLQGSPIQHALLVWLPPPSKLFEALTGSQGQLVLPAVLGLTLSIGDVVSGLVVILFLSLYWTINQVHFERLWLSLLPSGQRKQVRDIWRTVELDLGTYIRSEIIQSVLAALLLGLGYWLLGSPYPILLALTGALFWLIPVMGAPLAMILPMFLGMLSSVQLGLFLVFYTLVILIALEVWVEPRLVKRKWDNPILTLVIILALADTFGFVGIIIAPPVSAVCQILWNLLISRRVDAGAAIQVSDLKMRQARVWDTIKSMDRKPAAMVTNSMERLASMIEKAEPILQVALPADIPEIFQSQAPVIPEGGSPVSNLPKRNGQ